MQETEKIWMNGELVDWADAKVHVGVHGLHYGSGVFEGIRCYDTPKGPAVFRLGDHMQRLHNSAQLLYMEIPFSVDDLRDGVQRADRRQRAARVLHPPDRVLRLRRARRRGARQPGRDRDHELAVGHLPRRGGPAHRHPREDLVLAARVAERRPARLEGDGRLPQLDARGHRGDNAGYDEAILLTPEGTVADGSGENIFVVRDGVIYTPDLATGILPGITRDTVTQIAQDLGYTVVEKSLIRSDLYLADEVFMCGTAAEVTPLRSVDDHEIGVGEITLAIQKAYLDTVRGAERALAQWLDPVPQLARS